jgi:hypothetical protein
MSNATSQDTVKLELPRNDVGQIIDGLCCRLDAYRKTAEYFETGSCSDAGFVIEEVTDAAEARELEERYAQLIRALQEQVREQVATSRD